MRNLGLTATAAIGLLLAGCAFDDDGNDRGRYRYGNADQGGRYGSSGRSQSRGYSAGEVENSNNAVRGRSNYCDDDAEVCYKNGRPDVSDTRDRFGRDAARRID